jgi:ArsR family transcriptional regulator
MDTTSEISADEFFKARLQFLTTPSEVRTGLSNGTVVVLDVRDREEFAAEHIPGAMNVPLSELEAYLPRLPNDKTVVVYCCYTACHLSPTAALVLAENGFRVQELIGGIEEWMRRVGS